MIKFYGGNASPESTPLEDFLAGYPDHREYSAWVIHNGI